MIIIMKNDDANRKAAEICAKKLGIDQIYDFSNQWDTIHAANAKNCLIMDINDDTGFSKNIYFPELLAAHLIANKLPESVTDIYLLISEISDNLLTHYAHKLSQVFAQKYQRNITIHTMASLNYEVSLLSFHAETNLWKIEGMSKEAFAKQQHSDKKLIWEGENILQYMSSAQQTFRGVGYVWDVS